MKLKACLAILLCLVLGVTLMPVTAQAGGGEKYTVVLDPGEGSGTPIVYSAYRDEITESLRGTTGNCVFCQDVDGSVWFRMDEKYCPESFTAPEGYEFDRWDLGHTVSVSPGKTTCTAKWRSLPDSKYAIGNIKRVAATDEGGFKIGGYNWKLIGEDKDKGSGLVVLSSGGVGLTGTWQSAMETCDELYKNFTDFEKGLVIPTSTEKEEYEKGDGTLIAPALENAKVFLLSVGESLYYSLEWGEFDLWTRSEFFDDSFAVTVDGTAAHICDKNDTNVILPVFQLNLKAYYDRAQALPPELPEGTFKSKSGTYQITDKDKKTVQLIEGEVSAKGAFTIPKTVTYENTKYKVTAIRGMTFDGNSELKTIRITAGNLKKIGEYAFRFINPKAVFKIKGTKAQFKKIKKLIQASKGVPKGVKYQRVK